MNNYTGSPEQLKIIAEAMGYEIANFNDGFNPATVYAWINNVEVKYNPSTNAEQLLEIIEKFKIEITWLGNDVCTAFGLIGYSSGEGKTLAEAVLSAIWETIEVVK